MTYKIKNTIYIGVIWLVFTIGAGLYYWVFQPRQINNIKKEIKKINKQLEELPLLADEVQRLDIQFQDIKRRYDSRSKEIPQIDISSQTYEYISTAMDEAGSLKFNMKFIGTTNKISWGYNTYRLERGEAQFENLFKFIYFLENGKKLYKISALHIEQREDIDEETKDVIKWLDFEMEIQAYFVKNIPELSTSLAAKSLTMIPSPFDPFNSLITQIIATETPKNEINADKVEVKAVLPGKAFILYDNILRVIHTGDKVWRGSVVRINTIGSSVEFGLNEGGVYRRLVKKIEFEKL